MPERAVPGPAAPPTEAEWEKAARGTWTSVSWGNEFDGSRANFCDSNCPFEWKDTAVDDGSRSATPVGNYEAGKSPYGATTWQGTCGSGWPTGMMQHTIDVVRRTTRRGQPAGTQVGLRGGSWLYTAPTRTTERAGVPSDRRNENIGLRCVRAP